jgi:hypothetical protein
LVGEAATGSSSGGDIGVSKKLSTSVLILMN